MKKNGAYRDEYAKLAKLCKGLQKHYAALTRQREDKKFKTVKLGGFLFKL